MRGVAVARQNGVHYAMIALDGLCVLTGIPGVFPRSAEKCVAPRRAPSRVWDKVHGLSRANAIPVLPGAAMDTTT